MDAHEAALVPKKGIEQLTHTEITFKEKMSVGAKEASNLIKHYAEEAHQMGSHAGELAKYHVLHHNDDGTHFAEPTKKTETVVAEVVDEFKHIF